MSPDVKPRPISSVFGHSNYLPFQWKPDFKHGPFFAGYGMIPSDVIEAYTSPDLSAGIAASHNELIPSQDESPDPDKASRSLWPNIYELGIAKLKPVTQFLRDCEDHVNRLYHSRVVPSIVPQMVKMDLYVSAFDVKEPVWFGIYSTVDEQIFDAEETLYPRDKNDGVRFCRCIFDDG